MTPIRPENVARYPRAWPAISARIRERAAGQCECRGECGLDHVSLEVAAGDFLRSNRCPERDGGQAVFFKGRVVLTVAHLDHKPENCADDNLAAWCQRCHNRYDVPHRRETKRRRKAAGDLFGEGT
jgi:hypothetical protein